MIRKLKAIQKQINNYEDTYPFSLFNGVGLYATKDARILRDILTCIIHRANKFKN